jgi:DNA-3-methyladenine glycosylase
MTDLSAAFFDRDSPSVGRDLIGVTLLVNGVGGVIVETEAYDPLDPASHAFRGPTPRTASLFGPPGHTYIYRSHGLHWCLNMGCGKGRGVLIRALEPVCGVAAMIERRGFAEKRQLCSGPGKLTQALGVDHSLYGRLLDQPPFRLIAGEKVEVIAGPRIGISKGVETPWRFCLKGSPWLSKPSPI